MLNPAMERAPSVFLDLFRPPDRIRHAWIRPAWIAVLFLSGLALWGAFLGWGATLPTYHDWGDVTDPRLYFLQDAVLHGMLPLHISGKLPLGGITDRYLAIPDAFLSPQAFLLAFLPVSAFVLVNQFLLYAIGFLGLLWFERKFRLSAFALTILFLLFNFNGHVLSHFSVGHDTWTGYFLFPWFAVLVVRLLEGERSWRWVGMMALLLLGMLLQGSFHQFVWCLIFLALLAVASARLLAPAAAGGFFALLLSLFRLLPPAVDLSAFNRSYSYIGGYPTLANILPAMTDISLPGVFTFPPYVNWPLGSWELDLYVGLLGTAFLLLFGGYFWWKNRKAPGRFTELALPVAGLVVLSVGGIYQIVRALHIPLLDGERVASRMISLSFVFVLIIAVREFQEWLNGRPFSLPLLGGMAALLFVEGADLLSNFSIWMVGRAWVYFDPVKLIPQDWYGIYRPDPVYLKFILLGAAGSIIALAGLAYLVWAENSGRFGFDSLPLPARFRGMPRISPAVPVTSQAKDPAAGESPAGKKDE